MAARSGGQRACVLYLIGGQVDHAPGAEAGNAAWAAAARWPQSREQEPLAGLAVGERSLVDRRSGLLCLSAPGTVEQGRRLLLDAVERRGGDVARWQAGGYSGNAAGACRARRAGV